MNWDGFHPPLRHCSTSVVWCDFNNMPRLRPRLLHVSLRFWVFARKLTLTFQCQPNQHRGNHKPTCHGKTNAIRQMMFCSLKIFRCFRSSSWMGMDQRFSSLSNSRFRPLASVLCCQNRLCRFSKGKLCHQMSWASLSLDLYRHRSLCHHRGLSFLAGILISRWFCSLDSFFRSDLDALRSSLEILNKEENCCLVAMTLFRNDWSPEDWNQIVTKPIPFLRGIFAKAGMEQAVLSIWGKSLRSGRAPASPQQAESMQVHSSVLVSKLHKFLAKSGFNGVYATPKLANGRLYMSFKIIWLSKDDQSATVLAMKAPNCLGLVRGKASTGLRFAKDDFDRAWAVLCPGADKPQDFQGELMYKAEGLPFGTTAAMIAEWASKTGWAVQPVRALGPTAWLLRASTAPTPGLTMFNANPILLRFLPPRLVQQTPLLVGPKASRSPAEPTKLAADPWANWTGPRPTPATPAAAPRTIEGPIEQRLASQDDKIVQLQQSLEQIKQGHQQQSNDVAQRFDQLERSHRADMQQVAKTFDTLRSDLDQSLKQVVQQNSNILDSKLTELKQFFTRDAKRPLPPDRDAMDDWLSTCSWVDAALLPATKKPFASRSVLTWVCQIALYSCFFCHLFFRVIMDFSEPFVTYANRAPVTAGTFLDAFQEVGPISTRAEMMREHQGVSVEVLPRYATRFAMSFPVGRWTQPVICFLVWFCFVFCAHLRFPADMTFCPVTASRIGEAQHPGPPNDRYYTIAISNPTSILSKPSTYADLIANYNIRNLCH